MLISRRDTREVNQIQHKSDESNIDSLLIFMLLGIFFINFN